VTLASVAGQRRLTGLLSQAIARGTLPPTLLFEGPPGVGKWRVARAVAAALNCLAPVRSASGLLIDACGTCRSCDRIARGVHVDLITLEPDDRASIKIDVIRDLLDRSGYRPFEGRRRVAIVRDAETLEGAAQNALLKSLEEPPPGTVFILTTAVPGALLPTVLSRCMRLRFGRLSAAEVAGVLSREHGMTPDIARAAAALADGSVGQALAFESADLSALRELAMHLLQQTASTGIAATRLQAAAALVGPPRKERSRQEIAVILRMASSMLRDIELLNTGSDQTALANLTLADALGALARPFAGARARAAFVAVDRALDALARNAGTKVVAEWVSLQI